MGKNKDVLLLDVVNAINNAKKMKKIKGISIEVDNLPAGITQVDDIRAAIEDFKNQESLCMLMVIICLKIHIILLLLRINYI